MSAATADPASGGWPHRRVILAVLAISVVLNLFFVAGAAWTRIEAPQQPRGPEQRYQRIATELKLDAKQRAEFDRYIAGIRGRGDKLQAQLVPLLTNAWEETSKPQADPAQVTKAFDEVFDKRRQSQRETVLETLDFLATLSAEQRARFVALARERRGAWRGLPAQSR